MALVLRVWMLRIHGLLHVLWSCWRVTLTVLVCSCASQLRAALPSRAFGTRPIQSRMQKDRPRFFKVRPRTAIERAPSSQHGCMHAVHVASCSERAIALVMRRCWAVTLAGRAQRAGAVPPWAFSSKAVTRSDRDATHDRCACGLRRANRSRVFPV